MTAVTNLAVKRSTAVAHGVPPIHGDNVLTATEREGGAANSAPQETAADRRLPMASIRLRARQRALKTNWWVTLMYSRFAG
jgi:hypothetical protein